VHERNVGGVVEARAARQQFELLQHLLGLFMPGIGQINLVCLAVDPVVPRGFGLVGLGLMRHFGEKRRHRVDPAIKLGMVFGLPRDDERRTRLIDQDRVDLVDDRVEQATLAPLASAVLHVVAQVIEAEFCWCRR